MENSLLLYLNKRMGKGNQTINPENLLPGPVVTISREVGCAGLKLAKRLASKLNKNGSVPSWKVFSKEIFEETAKKLEIDQQKVKKILKAEGRNTFDEILGALGDKRFKSEKQIKKALINAIRDIANDGHCIIVGRGGYIIAHDIENSLHIRLNAPLEWRINKIAKRQQISPSEALKFIERTEKERESVRQNIKQGNHKEHFDIEINVSSFKTNDIVEMLEKTMLLKGILKQQEIAVSLK